MNQMRPVTYLGATLLISACLSVFVAPAAHAQVEVPSTDTVTGTATDTTQEVTGTVTGGVGTVTGEAEEVVNETVNDPGSLPDRVTNTVDDVVEEVPDGPVTGPVKDVVTELGNTIDEATGGTGTPPKPGKIDGRDPIGDPRERRGGRDAGGRDRVLGTYESASGLGVTSPDGIMGALLLQRSESAPSVELETAGPSFVDQVGQIALEAAKRLAFPMLLLALVGIFLAFHGRVGRRDPKLALAAVDPEQNLLDFK